MELFQQLWQKGNVESTLYDSTHVRLQQMLNISSFLSRYTEYTPWTLRILEIVSSNDNYFQ